MSVKIRLTFERNGERYTVDDELYHHEGNTVAEDLELAQYWWTEGNGGCDCNRSIWIERALGKSPVEAANAVRDDEDRCGNTIKLIGFEPDNNMECTELVKCPMCENLNRKHDVDCMVCGQPLEEA